MEFPRDFIYLLQSFVSFQFLSIAGEVGGGIVWGAVATCANEEEQPGLTSSRLKVMFCRSIKVS